MNDWAMIHEAFLAQCFQIPRRWRAAMTAEVARYGLTGATARPLFYIARLGDGVRPKDLAEALEIERPSLGQLLDRLESAGLILRRDDPHDRRGKTLHLTAEGEKIAQLTTQIAERMAQSMVAGLSDEEVSAGEALLAKILANMDGLHEAGGEPRRAAR